MSILCASIALLSPSAPYAEAPAPAFERPALAALYAEPEQEEAQSTFSYTFLELGYSVTDLDAIDDDAKGLTGRASLGLFDLLYVFLDYANTSTDYQNTDTDNFGLGAGVHFALTPKFDLVGEAAWLTNDIESDVGNIDDSNDGWTAMAGGRFMALPWDGGGLELNGGYRWIDMEGLLSDDETGAWEVGARVHFLKLFSVGVDYTFLEDDQQWGANARVSF